MMRVARALAVVLLVAAAPCLARAEGAAASGATAAPKGGVASSAGDSGRSLAMDQAVAFALEHNRDVIAARLGIREAELAEIAAGIYPNPVLSYTVGNLVVGAGNPGNVAQGAPADPGMFSQTVHNVGISEIIDIWSKRGARSRAAQRGVELRRFEVADVLRDIVHEVRSAFTDVTREVAERRLRHDMRDRYGETIRLSRARYSAGEISESEFRKIELEGLKYESEVISADADLDLTRKRLAALMGLTSDTDLPDTLRDEVPPDIDLALAPLVTRAMKERPDVRAAERAHAFAEASIGSARREALPDLTLGLSYTHSEFLVSGDNPNALGLGLALPLPIFDRNQAGVGRADLELRRADNEAARLDVVVNHEVSDAVRRVERSKTLLGLFEGGGMLERADRARQVAEKSYQAGAISLIELLEAQRTFLETFSEYLRAAYDYRQSRVDLRRAIGSD
jgi:cobalt-zinc-cadmium efflux system outer membrane protein